MRELPAVVVVTTAILLLLAYGVPLATTGAFALYIVAAVVVPGTLLWRAARCGRGWFVADVAAGTAVGCACEVLAYLPSRALGVPVAVLAWPVGVVIVFLAVPGLRRHWRCQAGADRPPAAWNWSLACVATAVLLWSVKAFRLHGLRWPSYATPDTDTMFHLALVGEAKHHLPLMTPWVSGETLHYHWFVYAEMAATSWVTGIEPQVLLLRLSPLVMIMAFVVMVAALARELLGHWWTGIAAVVVTFLVLAPDPYGWQLHPFFTGQAFSQVDDGAVLRLSMWTSPTQTFGAFLFVPVVWLMADLLRGCRRPAGRWVLLVVMTCAVMGAKATFLPLLFAGLFLVVVAGAGARLMLGRSVLARTEIMAMGLVVGLLVFAFTVLFGGQRQGLAWGPFAAMRGSGVGGTTGFGIGARPWQVAVLVLLTVWCWYCVWGGIAGLAAGWKTRGPRATPQPVAGWKATLLLLGIGIAGCCATALLWQSGDSQRFFIESARPYLAILAVGGLSRLLGDTGMTRRRASVLLCSAAGGVMTILVIRQVDGPVVPGIATEGSAKRLAVALLWPYVATFAAMVLVWCCGKLAVRFWAEAGTARAAQVRWIPLAAAVSVCAGFGLVTAAGNAARVVHDAEASGWREVTGPSPAMPRGTLEAGRWLRDHSDPDDLVATNAHCAGGRDDPCVNLRFAFAAYSERRMLVEGWGFTSTAHALARDRGTWVGFVPYWKPGIRKDNDAAFISPSAVTLGALRERYGVRWLFVDDTAKTLGQDLPTFAVLRFRSGDCTIFEISDSKR